MIRNISSIFATLFALVILPVSCVENSDNNKTLEYDVLNVNFSITTTGFELPVGSSIGVSAFCARDGETGVQMGTSAVLEYLSLEEDETSNLVSASESDIIEANSSDHGFQFYAVYPYSSGTDLSSVELSVPNVQEYESGVMSYLPFTASVSVTSIIPTVELDASTPFAVLNLSVPIDIIEEGTPSVLQSIEIGPNTEENFSGALAGSGTLNLLESGDFVLDEEDQSQIITLEFPDGGLALTESTTSIPIVVLPFIVPEGGFYIILTDVDGNSIVSAFLVQDSDAGASIDAGDEEKVSITRDADGVVAVSFPVEFLVCKVDDVQRFTSTTQPLWLTSGYWSCPDQEQAYATWNQVSDPGHPSGYTQFRETVNNGNVSSPGVKGVWTGDYWEFVLPVKNFSAGTTIKIEFPIYGRQEPVFWYIKYLDGDDWQIANYHTETCYDGETSMDCTFSMNRGPKDISETMTFENAITSGYIKIRIECADGTIQASSSTAVTVREYPYTDSSGYGAPYYFWDQSSTSATPTLTAITFSIVE